MHNSNGYVSHFHVYPNIFKGLTQSSGYFLSRNMFFFHKGMLKAMIFVFVIFV